MTADTSQPELGSAGCQPAVLGSLPSTRFARAIFQTLLLCLLCGHAAGKLPAATGWQPALPIHI
jgi:hypothetical protein